MRPRSGCTTTMSRTASSRSRDWWGNTQLSFEAEHTLRPVLTSGQAEAFAPLAADLFGVLPVSVWTTEAG